MKIEELINGIANAYITRSDGAMSYICLHLNRLNVARRAEGIYDTVYDIDGLMVALVELLSTPIKISDLSVRSLPFCMSDVDFDKFSAIGEKYMNRNDAELSLSMLARIGILVEYGIEREVPLIGASDGR